MRDIHDGLCFKTAEELICHIQEKLNQKSFSSYCDQQVFERSCMYALAMVLAAFTCKITESREYANACLEFYENFLNILANR